MGAYETVEKIASVGVGASGGTVHDCPLKGIDLRCYGTLEQFIALKSYDVTQILQNGCCIFVIFTVSLSYPIAGFPSPGLLPHIIIDPLEMTQDCRITFPSCFD